MRNLPDGWTGATMAMHDKYKTRIKLADQDILNILFRWTFCWYINKEIQSKVAFSNHIQSTLSLKVMQCRTKREWWDLDEPDIRILPQSKKSIYSILCTQSQPCYWNCNFGKEGRSVLCSPSSICSFFTDFWIRSFFTYTFLNPQFLYLHIFESAVSLHIFESAVSTPRNCLSFPASGTTGFGCAVR